MQLSVILEEPSQQLLVLLNLNRVPFEVGLTVSTIRLVLLLLNYPALEVYLLLA